MKDQKGWRAAAASYHQVINDPDLDSEYLRTKVLQPQLLEWLGDVSDLRLIDLGCGDGWLVSSARPASAAECDLVHHRSFPSDRQCVIADIEKGLPFGDEEFDIAVACLVLIFIPDLQGVLSQIHRVLRRRGRLVVALVHPYFYRTGNAEEDGAYRITAPLGQERTTTIRINESTEPLTYYYRPFPAYLNAILSAGFSITRLDDLFVDMTAYETKFGCRKKGKVLRTGHVPLYTLIDTTRLDAKA